MSKEIYVKMPSGYVHKMLTRDGAMRADRMLGITIASAYRAWEAWNSIAEIKVQGISPALDQAMRHLYRQISESEVFLSGLSENCDDQP